jgi:hypothetical protein
MPNTTAVRKAKDMMAASTLSLVRNSIIASMPDQADVDAKLPRAKNANLGVRRPHCQACFDAAMRYYAGKFQVTRDPPALVRNNHAGVRLL